MNEEKITVEQVNDIYRKVFAGVENNACNVACQYLVVSYQGFLPIAPLQQLLNRLMTGYRVVLLRNRNKQTYNRAVGRLTMGIHGKRYPTRRALEFDY